MTIVRVFCANCGKYLGKFNQPQFGMDENKPFALQHFPDCQYCNPYYYKTCKTCGQKNIDSKGICRACKSDNSLLELSLIGDNKVFQNE